MPARRVTIVGIGADGWSGLVPAAQNAIVDADVVLGGQRQLDLLPVTVASRREPWPSPLLPALQGVLDAHCDDQVVVLASGDPMNFGIGATLIARLGPSAVRVIAHPSSISLACARLGWPVPGVEVVSLVGRPLALLHPAVQPGRRVLVLVAGTDAAADVCALLRDRGFGASEVTVLEQLGGYRERMQSAAAATWAGAHDELAVVAIECHGDVGVTPLPRTPGLPEDAFEHDGQITKREIRALVLAALVPVPGQLLWDVGSGSGSVAVEWMRTHPDSRAIAVEPRADRRARIAANAEALGVPGLRIVDGSAPEALADLPRPDAVFIGGGVSVPGVIEAGLAALPVGGRLVANAVTVETEVVLAGWHGRLGGALTRIAIQRAGPIGGFTGWRPAMPVTQWSYTKENA